MDGSLAFSPSLLYKLAGPFSAAQESSCQAHGVDALEPNQPHSAPVASAAATTFQGRLRHNEAWHA